MFMPLIPLLLAPVIALSGIDAQALSTSALKDGGPNAAPTGPTALKTFVTKGPASPTNSWLFYRGVMTGNASSDLDFAHIHVFNRSSAGIGHLNSAFSIVADSGGGSGLYTASNSTVNITQKTTNIGNTGYYAAMNFVAQATVNDNGTPNKYSGHLYGINPNVRLVGAATYWAQLVGSEIDIGAEAGTSVNDIIGEQIVRESGTVRGSRSDIGISLNNATATIGWSCGLCFGAYSGYQPMDRDGTLIGTFSHAGSVGGPMGAAIANGVDFRGYTFKGYAFASPGFSVDGAGGQKTKTVSLASMTVGSLPHCDEESAGTVAYVTDARSPAYGAPLEGGSRTRTLAMCNGEQWTAH